MKCQDFNLLQKQTHASLYLIIGPEDDRKRALQILLKEESGRLNFSSDSFLKESFIEEMETPSFLAKKKVLVIENVDGLNKESLNLIANTLRKPNSWIKIVMTAQKEPPEIASIVEANGVLFIFPRQEKPWEKEKRVSEWIIEIAKEKGVRISAHAAHMLVQSVDAELLENEFEKLLCFVGKRGEITEKDIQMVSTKEGKETFFQLADAIFERKSTQAIQMGRTLLEEGDLFLLLSQLRSQIEMASQVLLSYADGGKQAITKAFPFLKGAFLDKKLRIFQNYGASRLKRATFLLFETELKAKKFKFNEILFEMLIAKLTDDSLSLS